MSGFLDMVKDGINRGVAGVSEGAKQFAEKANINTKIKDIEKEKGFLLQNMGTLVYNLQSKGEINVEQCAGMFAEIAEKDKIINALQQQLQTLEAMKTQQVPHAQSAAAFEPVNNGPQCECGFVNKEGAKFCSKCGKQL